MKPPLGYACKHPGVPGILVKPRTWGVSGDVEEVMQSLASLAVERHAWTRASLHGACAAQPPRALTCLDSSGDAMVFAPRHAWEIHAVYVLLIFPPGFE